MYRKATATEVIPAIFPNLPTETPTCIKRIVGWEYRTTAAKMIVVLNQHLNSSVSTKTALCELNRVPWKSRHQETSAFHYQHSEEVEVVYRSQGLVCRPSDMLWRVQFFSFHNCKASLCVEAAQGTLQPSWLPASHSKARKWISDSLGSHIVKSSRSHRWHA